MAFIPITRFILIVAIILALLHFYATFFYLYSFYWWFDIPVHLLGGFCAGLISVWCSICSNRSAVRMDTRRAFLSAVLGSLVIGLVWELFEYKVGIAWDHVGSYKLDTLKDVALDMAGGYAAYLYVIAKGYHKGS